MKRRLVFDLVFCCLCAAITAEAGGQGGAEPRSPVRFNQLGAPCGLRQYVSMAWGVVGIDVSNAQDQPVDVLAAFSFSRDPDLQFARRVGVPAHAVRRTWVPVRLPRVPTSRASLPCYGLLIDDRSGPEVVLRPDHEGVQHSVLLRVNHDKPVTGAFLGQEAESDGDDVDFAYEAAIAMRTARGYQRGLVLIRDRDLPPLREVFDGLDQIVLWNDRFASDVAILSPLRAWLNDGGELWIMLDRVDVAGVERLLGDVFTCQLVDRVALHEVLIEDVDKIPLEPPAMESYEQPLDLVRVLVSGMRVTHTVEGWPAAFWRPVGRGRVVFTTLEARAWIGRPMAQRPRWDPNRMADYWPTRQLEALPLLQLPEPPLCEPGVFRDYLSERIGYRIASRGPVSGVLGLFCGALLLAAVGLARRRRLEHLAWIAPGLALAAAVPLAGLGLRSQRAVPATVGQAQFIEVSDGGDQINASGLLAFYDPALGRETLGATQGGVFEPEDATAVGTTRRMVWTDLDRWHWEHLRPTAGLWTAAFRRSGDLPRPLAVHGTFCDAGFVAHWTDSSLALTDAVIAVPGQPYLAVRADGSHLVAGSEDVLPPGRYVAGGWLSDEQRRRQAAFERMLDSAGGTTRQVLRPMLLAWSDALEMGFRLPHPAERVGTSLWAIPLNLDRAVPGTQVVIPAPFVPFRTVNRPDGAAASSLYDHRTGEWIESHKPSEMWLRFQAPEAVLPLRLERARLTLQITAPGCMVEILRAGGAPRQPLRRLSNPIGLTELTLSGETLPPLDAHGRLLVGIAVRPAADGSGPAQVQPWKIERVQMEIAGVVGDGLCP